MTMNNALESFNSPQIQLATGLAKVIKTAVDARMTALTVDCQPLHTGSVPVVLVYNTRLDIHH